MPARIHGAAAALLVVSLHASAQAWVPPKGEGAVGVEYQNFYVHDHLFGDGQRYDIGHIRTSDVALDLSYGITDALAFSFTLPYVASKYDGKAPHVLDGKTLDDGTYHGTFADYRLELRYNAFQRPFFLTPFVAVVIPSHDYVYFSHSAVSRGLHEYQLGINAGRRLDPLLASGVVHLRYQFAFAEKVLGVSHNRSNLDLELGYFLTPALTMKWSTMYQRTHGGLDFPPLGTDEFVAFTKSVYWTHHDQISRINFLDLGPGFDYAITASLSVYAGYVWTVWGENTHAIESGFSLGAACTFSPEHMARRIWHVIHPRA